MYLGIDIGGTKTLIACFTNEGIAKESVKFPTPKVYADFLKVLAFNVANLSTNKFIAVGAAAPGAIDRKRGIATSFGNLAWRDVPLCRDITRMLKCPVIIDNDANLAGLSEANLIPQYGCVLYVTISTGIGTGIITNQEIDPEFADSEGGHIMLEHNGKVQMWEKIASGQAIVKRFGKRASEINDQKIWKVITHDIGLGLYDLIAVIQPDAVVLGGGVLTSFNKFESLLMNELQRYQTPLTPIPPILQAQRPDEAVVYGCYHLAKTTYGTTR